MRSSIARAATISCSMLFSAVAPRSLPRSAPVAHATVDPLYVDTINRRWQAYAGEIARHAVSGQSFAELAEERGPQA
jgi:hypothetical protein